MPKLTSQQIVEQSRKYTLFEWTAQAAASPIAIDRAEGSRFWDADGKRYLDFNSQLMNVNLGHGHQKLIQAIQDQVAQLAYVSPHHTTAVRAEAGRAVSEIVPMKDSKVFFTLGGAESNENAVKLARLYTGRHKVLARYRSYHGGTALAMTMTGDPRRWPSEPGAPGVVHILDPFCYRCPFGQKFGSCGMECTRHVEEVIQYEGPNQIAALIMETVVGTNGIIIPPADYLQRVRDICSKHGILMICDEVMSGFGRTGQWFAVNNWNVVPDIITMAKGLTCSYIPFGAVAVSGKIAEYFEDHVFAGGLTANSHPVGCAAAVAAIQIYREEKIIERARETGKLLGQLLDELKGRHPSVGEARHIGMFAIIDVVKDRRTHEAIVPFNAKASEMGPMVDVGRFLRENGVSTFVRWNTIHVNPPLVISEAELREGLAVIDEALKITDRAIGA